MTRADLALIPPAPVEFARTPRTEKELAINAAIMDYRYARTREGIGEAWERIGAELRPLLDAYFAERAS